MGILQAIDIHFVLSLIVILVVFSVFYAMASKRQKAVTATAEAAIKLQAETNRQLNHIVQEIRRSNRLLGALADLELGTESMDAIESSVAVEAEPSVVESQNKLYVGNIDYAASESELEEHFARFGTIEFVNIPVNRYNGRARGFGFVSFIAKEDAERAMALHGSEFKGRQIQVNFAKERGETA